MHWSIDFFFFWRVKTKRNKKRERKKSDALVLRHHLASTYTRHILPFFSHHHHHHRRLLLLLFCIEFKIPPLHYYYSIQFKRRMVVHCLFLCLSAKLIASGVLKVVWLQGENGTKSDTHICALCKVERVSKNNNSSNNNSNKNNWWKSTSVCWFI